MNLQNIGNNKRTIFLFCRNNKGELEIERNNTFFPFFYEPDEKGQFLSYDNLRLRKVFTSEPAEVTKIRSLNSYSSDIKFCNNYLIHKIPQIDKTIIKYIFLDIEIVAHELPNIEKPIYPISSITIYDSILCKFNTWYLGDFAMNEEQMLKNFIEYIYQSKPDILLAWNMDNFDYPYLHNRCKQFNIELSKEISPIHQQRYGEDKLLYPTGISIIDYLTWFRKIFMREPSYALDNIAQKYLGEKSFKKVDYSKVSLEIKEKNINDVLRLLQLENKFQIIPYYDEIRRMTKTQWEDLYHNSRIIEMLLLEEAKNKNLVLPNRKHSTSNQSFQGATREVVNNGVHSNIGKFDLTSAYPQIIIDFCLDSQNITSNKEGICVNNIYFKQNPDALLPSIVKKLLIRKNELKKLNKNSPSQENKIKYDAIKGIVNSSFGVFGNEYFRLFDINIASSITLLIRDLLLYVKDMLTQQGHEVIYLDTDSIFITENKDISYILNSFIKKWAKEKYNKDAINLTFEYEGYFDKLFVLGKCHYVGYLKVEDKIHKEIKGVEIKRSNSSKYEAYFQETLIDYVLNKKSKQIIIEWITQERARLRTLSITEIAFPCKLNNKDYKNEPIFQRALTNTKSFIKNFNVYAGELFYYIYVNSKLIDEKHRPINVIGFTEDCLDFVKQFDIDWNEMERRNIITKTNRIFESLGWELIPQTDLNQKMLI